jgi:hypothetical protein
MHHPVMHRSAILVTGDLGVQRKANQFYNRYKSPDQDNAGFARVELNNTTMPLNK